MSKTVWRLPPCPAYDIEGSESWLEYMSQKGYALSPDGFVLGFGLFEKTEPKTVRYRLEGAPKSTSMWSDDGGEPSPEQNDLMLESGWEYVCHRGEFYIYRSDQPQAPEPNTDPEVQELALRAVKKRSKSSIISSLLWFFVYPVIFLRGEILLMMVTVKTWRVLLVLLLVLTSLAGSMRELVYLSRLSRRLRSGRPPEHSAEWSRRAAFHRAFKWGRALLLVFLIVVTGLELNGEAMHKDLLPNTAVSPSQLPFADMYTLLDGKSSQTWGGLEYNCHKSWSDWLAPVNYDWQEHLEVRRQDGSLIDGGLYVDYHQTISPLIAKGLARDLLSHDRRKAPGGIEEYQSLPDGCLYAYRMYAHRDVIIIVKDKTVVRAALFQSDAHQQVPLEEWASIMVDSIE